MHELLLHASVPSSRHDQVLSILAGIAAMQPIPMLERHLVFKPSRPPLIAGKAGPQQGVLAGQMKSVQGQMHGDLFYLKLVEDVKDTRATPDVEQAHGVDGSKDVDMMDNSIGSQVKTNADVSNDGSPPTSWTLQFRDLPDANKGRPVTSRAMADIPVASGNPLKFMAAMDYTQTGSLLLSGHRLTHSSILLQLFRALIIPNLASPDENSHVASFGPRTLLASASPLDPSGSYILQASLRVSDGQKVDRMQQGTTELLSLKEMLKGVVDLEMADRLGLDTRVR